MRRSPPALLRDLAREIADVSFNRATDRRRHVDQRQLRARSRRRRRRDAADRASRRSAAVAGARRAARRSPSSFRRRSCATAKARPSSSPSPSKAAATPPNATGSRARIAHSPLVKTAFFASDPNLGRIVCAIGNAGIPDLEPRGVSFWLDDVLVVDDGGRAASYREEDGQRVMAQAEIGVRVALGRGTRRDDGVDMRFLARLRQHQRGLSKLKASRSGARFAAGASGARRGGSGAARIAAAAAAAGARLESARVSLAQARRARLPASGPASARDPARRPGRDRRAEAR